MLAGTRRYPASSDGDDAVGSSRPPALDDLEPDAVSGVQGHAEPLGDLGELRRERTRVRHPRQLDKLMVGHLLAPIFAPAMLFRPIDAEWSHDPA